MMFRSNVPIVDLSCLRRRKSWSFIPNHQSTDYYTSNEYLIDAIDVSLVIPITYQPRSICGDDRRENNFRRMKQMILSPVIRRCKEKPSCTWKKHQHASSIRCETVLIIRSPSVIPQIKTTRRPTRDASRYITSHTRFGRGVLALYFQKHRFISPIENEKNEQFLCLLKDRL